MTEVVKQEFVTPDRGPHQSTTVGEEKESMSKTSDTMNQAKTVTPAEPSREGPIVKKEGGGALELVANAAAETPEDRKVRFGKGNRSDSFSDSPTSTDSQRGLVSRRGGRVASPGRVAVTSPKREGGIELNALADGDDEKKASKPADDGKENGGDSSAAEQKESGPLSSKAKGKAGEKKSTVTFSPVPPPRTPTRSPTGRFQSLPVLDDETLKSPGSLFLSPQTPKGYREDSKPAARLPMRSPKTPRSPRTPRRDDQRFLNTPTDFTMDYGKHPNSGSFDSSNVLSWLQSPTANGLFSPGFGSMLNTPRGAPRTPRTPTVSTSFFFSDVAGLPGSGDPSPKAGADSKKSGSRGMPNIICISPLASSKAKGGVTPSLTPTINYRDMFASPEKARGLPMLGESPLKASRGNIQTSASKDPSVDAVNMAERELMEDEDLSVLLQLASNTPKANGERPVSVSTSEGTHVFRSPTKFKGGKEENLPSLQLPIIGGKSGEANATRLARKTHSRDHADAHGPLGIRPSVSSSSKSPSDRSENDENRRKDGKGDSSVKPPKTGSMQPPMYQGYMPPHHYGHPEVPYYPHPGMPPHSGSMRVVVGGPPRQKSSPPRSPHSRAYPPPPGYPHHPHYGVPPPHMHHPYYPPPPPHHQAHRHVPMYSSQPPQSKNKTTKPPPTTLTAAKGTKRPLAPQTPSKPTPAKKQKKSPSSAAKKKTRSPPAADKANKQKPASSAKTGGDSNGDKNDKAAQLAAAILRGVTMRPSGKWQAQLYFAGKSRYIGVFDTREKAALAYEIAREKLKNEKQSAEGAMSAKATEAAVNAARQAAFEGVNERDPRA